MEVGPLVAAFRRLDLVSLRQRAAQNEDNGGPDEGTEQFLAADNISMATWNEFARLDRLPHGLQLRQLLWVNDQVLIVQAAIGRPHEGTANETNIQGHDNIKSAPSSSSCSH